MYQSDRVTILRWVGGASISAIMAWTTVAAAYGDWEADVPNGGVNSCATCHEGAPALNSFGTDIAVSLSGGAPDWVALWDLDSDSDGQTNGEELGDPCGDWTEGDTPGRTTDISNPGDSTDTSADPNTPACGGAGGGGGSTSSGVGGDSGSSSGTAPPADTTEDDSGCSTSAASNGSGIAALGLLGLALLLGRRRRRS